MSSCIICAMLVFYVKLFLTPKYFNVFVLCSSLFTPFILFAATVSVVVAAAVVTVVCHCTRSAQSTNTYTHSYTHKIRMQTQLTCNRRWAKANAKECLVLSPILSVSCISCRFRGNFIVWLADIVAKQTMSERCERERENDVNYLGVAK